MNITYLLRTDPNSLAQVSPLQQANAPRIPIPKYSTGVKWSY